MKNLLKFSGALLVLILFSYSSTFAQSGDIKIGAGLAFGTGVFDGDAIGTADINNDLGIRVDGVYTISEDLRGVVDFVFYFPKEESGVKITVWELNFNGNYIFQSDEDLLLYGLGGLNITNLKTTIDGGGLFGSISGSDSEIGLNLGGGLEYGLDFGAIFGEVKYIISNADQLTIGAGVRFGI